MRDHTNGGVRSRSTGGTGEHYMGALGNRDLRRTSESDGPMDPLSAYVRRVENSVVTGNGAIVDRLIGDNLGEFWYGFPLDRARQILLWVTEQGAGNHGLTPAARAMLTMDGDLGVDGKEPDQTGVGPIFALRMSGHSDKALELVEDVFQRRGEIQTLFDPRGGTNLLITVQCGITAMLAGEYARALTFFTAGQVQPVSSTLPFLTRDCYVKSAIIHGAFGDVQTARRELDSASGIARTDSWAELLIDANEIIARALIFPTIASRSQLLAIPLHELGEMWPFYILALMRIGEVTGPHPQVIAQIQLMEELPLPRVAGIGIAGNVFPAARCLQLLQRGDVTMARRLISLADPNDVLVQRCMIKLELAAGRFRVAQRTARTSAKDPRNARLRRVQAWSLAALAESHLALGDPELAEGTLGALAALPGGARSEDFTYFGERTRAFAADKFPQWPIGAESESSRHSAGQSQVKLTRREFEILQLLNQDLSRAEMAERLYITVNTLKSHLKSLYRKLGVTTKEAALLRGKVEGWL